MKIIYLCIYMVQYILTVWTAVWSAWRKEYEQSTNENHWSGEVSSIFEWRSDIT